MRRIQIHLFVLVSLFFMPLVQGSPTFADDPEECTIRVEWTKPTTGTPVVRYKIEADVNGVGFAEFSSTCTDTFYFFTQPHGSYIKVKVAGIDSQNRQGPFSQTSLPMIFGCNIPDGNASD